ncbi:MAG: TIGR01212 family radical SAM protein [Lachnospiraceae bacterium]|nr:TIGR01212 family radical SAM protein [Lachnospiraceae bacterium]
MQLKQTSNPKYRWGEKPYYSLDYYLRQTFGEKVYKIALESGMTCPNRDGTTDTRGCIFCSAGGSGEFAMAGESVTEQINAGIRNLESGRKEIGRKYIAYFQSFSNTYAPIEVLHFKYFEALSHPDVTALSIATRPDCFTPAIYDLLEKCNRKAPTWVELGLQTIHEDTAKFIRRGYSLDVFENTVHELRKRGITVIIHIILGLPGETKRHILDTIHYLNNMDIQGIKLQLLHILRGTDLADYVQWQNSDGDCMDESCMSETPLHILTEDEYVDWILACIGNLSPDIVVHRLTGDGAKDLLLAPLWSLNKRKVLNHISHAMKVQGIYQGKFLN